MPTETPPPAPEPHLPLAAIQLRRHHLAQQLGVAQHELAEAETAIREKRRTVENLRGALVALDEVLRLPTTLVPALPK